ncbi:MAG: hypothetical protein QOE58_1657 [Actinomycetota bacterium]|nr:hypothetical protein [Actinomycetota bacterium]
MERTEVEKWIADYERLWRTPGTDILAEIFTADAGYRPSPWKKPLEGLDAISLFWDSERNGPDEKFKMSSEVVALDGKTAVVGVSVDYGASGSKPWRDLWVLNFAEDGRCSLFEEWPFAPDQPDGH